MTNRQRALAVLRYEKADRLPIVHFGFWTETLQKWNWEGHLSPKEAKCWNDGNEFDQSITKKLGFDFNWYSCYHPATGLFPGFEREVLDTLPDGTRKIRNYCGAVVMEKDEAGSIPAEVGHLLQDRKSWETYFLPRLQYSEERLQLHRLAQLAPPEERDIPLGLHCGSLFGEVRNWLGLEGLSYLYVDDEDLYDEILDTVGSLCYFVTKGILERGGKFDFAHFWEDICYKNGPLISPSVFTQKVGPHYRRITELLSRHGVDIISLDCDGLIDKLLPVWLQNGVNTMFPIEVGTWGANIAPWREEYGKTLRGVGGMDKKAFACDYAAIDREIERLRPLVELGGYIPCPDHRIPPDAVWENVQYYCDRMHTVFG